MRVWWTQDTREFRRENPVIQLDYPYPLAVLVYLACGRDNA